MVPTDYDYGVLRRVVSRLVAEDSAAWLLAQIEESGWPAGGRNQVLGLDGKRYSGSNYWYPDLLVDFIDGLRSEHLSVRQIARLLKLSVGTVHSRCSGSGGDLVIGDDLKGCRTRRPAPERCAPDVHQPRAADA